jgi:hypothetical protein
MYEFKKEARWGYNKEEAAEKTNEGERISCC